MNFLLTWLLIYGYHEMSNSTNQQINKTIPTIEFMDDFPLKLYDGFFFTFDTTNLLKQKFIFVVSGNRIAYFKQTGRIFIVEYVNRERKRFGYIDHFKGSGYKVKLAVVRVKKVAGNGTVYKGILEFNCNGNVTAFPVHGFYGEYKPNPAR